MTSIPTTSATGMSASAAAPASSAASAATKSALGKDDFLKLMTTQLRRQDPMNPVDDTQFLAQMAQFSTLEQITNVGTGVQAQLASQATSQALALAGKTVSYVDAKGVTQTGVVDAVVFDKGAATLTIGGAKGIQPSNVSVVHGDSATTTPSPSTAAPSSGTGTPTTVSE